MQPAALSVSCLFFHLEIRELSQALRLFPSALSYLKLFHIFEGVPRQGRTKKQMTVCSLPPSRSPIVGLLLYVLVFYRLLLLCWNVKNILALFSKNGSWEIAQTWMWITVNGGKKKVLLASEEGVLIQYSFIHSFLLSKAVCWASAIC